MHPKTSSFDLHRPWALVGLLLVAAASVVVLASSGGFVAWSLGGIMVGLAFVTWDT